MKNKGNRKTGTGELTFHVVWQIPSRGMYVLKFLGVVCASEHGAQ